jgi:DNA-binding IscR family transcriptional regulator
VNQVVRQSGGTVTVQRLQDALNIPSDAAARIVSNLVKAGILREMQEGVWARVSAFPSSR